MSVSFASESRLLAHEESQLIRTTHYPDIQGLDVDALRKTRADLRKHLDKARTIAWHKRREVRGKAEPRASGASRNSEHAARRKQVFARALKRTNRQITRLEAEEARRQTVQGMRRALKARTSARVYHPPPGRTANPGAVDNPGDAQAMIINPSRAGSVSQANKVFQAQRDS